MLDGQSKGPVEFDMTYRRGADESTVSRTVDRPAVD